jgi:hypothetical protein
VGAAIGAVASFFVVFRKDDLRGTVHLGREHIRWQRVISSPFRLVSEETTWPYEVIERCVLIPGEAIGKRFALLIIFYDDSYQILGIRPWVDLKKVGRLIKSHGVDVGLGKRIPPDALGPVHAQAWLIGVACVTGVLFAAMLLVLLAGDG